MENTSDKIECNLTEEELRELLTDLPNIIRDLNEVSDEPEITN
ncbi:hypothetical protein SATMO3_12830 [Sporomusa aerivorans]